MNKKVWQKPTLIVLVRSKPEETVLVACKDCHIYAGPVTHHVACMQWGGLPRPPCDSCYTLTAT